MLKNLLLVDDDVGILKQMSFALSSLYNVKEIDNSEEALKYIDNNEIDIALIDLGLPPFENSHREGRIVVNKLLAKTEAKVIILTGQESREYAKEFISMGVFDYLMKPIEIPSLIEALKRASFFIENEQESKDMIQLSFETSLEEGLKGSADKAQKELLIKVLNQTDFNVNQTAKILGISRENCYYFLKKFQIKR